MTDYSESKNRKVSNTEVVITSSDDILFYYNRDILCKHAKKISEMKMSANLSIKLNYPREIVNRFLNYLTNSRSLDNLNQRTLSAADACLLHKLGREVDCEELAKMAQNKFLNLSYPVTQMLIDGFRLYDKEHKDTNEKQLFAAIANGIRSIEGKVDTSFLSDCFDYMMGSSCNDRKYLLRTIIPMYEPTDEQLARFTINLPEGAPRLLATRQLERASRIRKGIADPKYIEEFCITHRNNVDNPGVFKFMIKLVQLGIFSI